MNDDKYLVLVEFGKALLAGPLPLIGAAIVGCAIREWVDARKGAKR